MKKRVQDEAPKRSKEAQNWINENLGEQETRYEAIAKEMDDLAPQREKWYEEFLSIMRTRGFNFNGDMRRVIPEDDIPKKPNRKDRVVW